MEKVNHRAVEKIQKHMEKCKKRGMTGQMIFRELANFIDVNYPFMGVQEKDRIIQKALGIEAEWVR